MTEAASDPAVVAQQADAVAVAWSAPGAPASWQLTAAQFALLRDDPELLAIASSIPPDRLPPLLFEAAASYLVLDLEPLPLRDWFPRVGELQPPVDGQFRAQYRDFCLDHRERLLELCASHRYQMNEVGRCADLLPALAPVIEEGRELALVDIGTGAGLALHLDRYRYVYRGPGSEPHTVGDERSGVVLETELRGSQSPPIPESLPRIVDRVGVDVEPLDLRDEGVRNWLAACVPQEIGAVTRFHSAVEVAMANPSRTVRGDACEVLASVLKSLSAGPLVCLVDSYVHVFFNPDQLAQFRAEVDDLGARHDLDWISIDPLVPLGGSAERSVTGVPVPSGLSERAQREGVFGVIGRLRYREGSRTGELLGLAHPGAAWLEWLPPPLKGSSDGSSDLPNRAR